jgi:tripartite-type tricarboxylate transporter receptor subunit TctC
MAFEETRRKTMNRRTFTSLTAATLSTLLTLAFAQPAQSQDSAGFPKKPIRIIVAGPPGIPPDVVARIIGEKLSASLGQPVLVENRPGTSGIIGLQALARSAPDGYTLGIISVPAVVTPHLFTQTTYDIEKDFAPVSMIAWGYGILAVSAAKPLKSVADLVAAAKATPGKLTFATAGNGTPPHLAGEMFKGAAGVDITHIPYKGTLEAVSAVVAGDVDMMIGATGAISPQVKSGKLRALATSAPKRIAGYPDLPTLAELGYKVEIRDWMGIVAPAGTPADLVARLHAEIAKATANPEVRQRLEGLGTEIATMGSDEFGAYIRGESQRWAKVVRDSGIKPD